MKYQPGDLVIFNNFSVWFVLSTTDEGLMKHAILMTYFNIDLKNIVPKENYIVTFDPNDWINKLNGPVEIIR